MTKTQILAVIRLPRDIDILNAIFNGIGNALVNKETVKIEDFGTFEVVAMRRKWGRQFHSHQALRLMPRYKIRFRACKKIEKELNDKNPLKEENQ